MVETSAEQQLYNCPWCGSATTAVTASTCPACGSPIDVQNVVSLAEWTKLPAIKDMAKIQFGHSFLQVEGKLAPIADFSLAKGDGFYFPHHLLLWRDDQINITNLPFGLMEVFKRLLSGLPLVMTQAQGPGRLALSRDLPGELIVLPMRSGDVIDVKEKIFMAATHSITYDWIASRLWAQISKGRNESEKIYPIGMFLDRFMASNGPGLLLLHGSGNVFLRELARGQTIFIKPKSFLFKESNVHANLCFEYPAQSQSIWLGRNYWHRYSWLQLTGPGRVAIQSQAQKLEDDGSQIICASPSSTIRRW